MITRAIVRVPVSASLVEDGAAPLDDILGRTALDFVAAEAGHIPFRVVSIDGPHSPYIDPSDPPVAMHVYYVTVEAE